MQRQLPDFVQLQQQRVLVTGGHGMLSRAFVGMLAEHAPQAVVWAPSRSELDVCNAEAMKAAASFGADIVVHCAARVDADFCETDHAAARASIVGGTINAIELAKATGARLLYPQSFLVYDGEENPITERTVPKPLSVYGDMKLEAEARVLDSSADAISVRMAGFFGGYAKDTNFVGKFVPHLSKLIAQGTTGMDIGDRVWQPTYTDDLALNALALLEADKRGVYCMACHGEASFHDLASEIVRQLGLAERFEVRRIDAVTLAGREAARRPLRAVIDNQRLREEGLDLQRPWQDALAAYLSSPYFRTMF